MQTLILNDDRHADIVTAARIIKNGGLVAFPTETVYGLGADATDPQACRNIFAAKKRPADNPLIVHIASPEDAEKYAFTSKLYYKLASLFMPGPLTVILPKKATIPDSVSAGLDSVAIRVPIHKTAHELIKLSERPIAAPSANLSGKPSPTTASHVIADMDGRIDAILCGGASEVGVESTVVKLVSDDELVICRPGGITPEMLGKICNKVTIDQAVLSRFEGKPISPGMKYRHYAPTAPVTVLVGDEDKILAFLSDKKDFGVLCFDEDVRLLACSHALSFGSCKDLSSQAHLLFDRLRAFDELEGLSRIYARMPSRDGVGLAVYNRLIKAAGFDVLEL